MSYKRAWNLIDDMSRSFRLRLVVAVHGGLNGGGSTLTPFAKAIVRDYRAIEADANAIAARRLSEIKASCRT